MVGRERESQELAGHLAEALEGRGSVVLLAGEAGIGKTTLAEQVAVLAESRGALATWGRALEPASGRPYTPWLEALRAWVDRVPRPEVETAIGPAGPVVTPVLPEVGADPEGVAGDGSDGSARRFRLIEALGQVVARAARRRPWVIVLEDLHWADESSLALAESVGRATIDSGLLLVCTYRDTELSPPLVRAVDQLTRLPRSVRLHLRGLDERSVRLCLEAAAGRSVSAEEAGAVWRRTGGNPFFVVEVGRSDEARSVPPEGIVTMVRARLSPLPQATLDLLEAAAVLGQEFRDDWLAAVTGSSVADLLARLDPAVAAGVVVRPALGRHAFLHALIQESLVGGLPANRRAELHERAGEAIERSAGAAVDEYLDALAHHYTEAATLGEVVRGVRFRQRAAERARRLLAYPEAAEHLDQACALAELTPSLAADERYDLLVASGEAWTRVAAYDRAKTAFARAMAIARTVGDARRLATAAIGHCGPIRLERNESSLPLLDEALATLPPDEAVLRARVVARRALAQPYDQAEESLAWAREAWRAAKAVDDPVARSLAALARCFVSFTPDALDDAVKTADEGLAAARRTGDPDLIGHSLFMRSLVAMVRGEFADVERLEEERRQAARRLLRPVDLLAGLVYRTREHLLRGELDAAEALIVEQRALEARLEGPPGLLPASTPQLFWLRWEQGRAAELRDLLDHLRATIPPQWGLVDALAGLVAVQVGDVDAVRSVSASNGAWGVTYSRYWELACASEFALAAGDRGRMADVKDALADARGVQVNFTTIFYGGPCDYYRGRLEAALGQPDAAVESLEPALRFVDAAGARPHGVRVRVALAAALDQRGRAQDRARSRALLDEAAATAQTLGIPVPVPRPPPGKAPSPAGVTSREADVLALLAAGRSNREIASELHLSVKTVERHLEALYRKLGVKNRTEAAMHAVRRSLTE